MRAVKIDSKNRSLTECQVEGLEDLQEAVGGLIECAMQLDDESSLYVNEEGLLHEDTRQAWFYFKGAHQPFAGNGILVGPLDDDGNDTPFTWALDEVKRRIRFMSLREVAAMAEMQRGKDFEEHA